jgi:hypothetical protein
MLPTLMAPALGGTNVTHAIGSWMRSSGVNGLVFPSARSNTSVSMWAGAELLDWNGWNFLDYRTAKDLPATEVTTSQAGWPDFLQPGAQLTVATDDEHLGSWKVIGVQDRYDALKNNIEESAHIVKPAQTPIVPPTTPSNCERMVQPDQAGVIGGSPMSNDEVNWVDFVGVIAEGGDQGIARFLAISEFICNRRDGNGLEEWIEAAFHHLPKADQQRALVMLLDAYVRKSEFSVSMCDPEEIVTAPCLGSGTYKLSDAVELAMVAFNRKTTEEPIEIHRRPGPSVLGIDEIKELAASPFYR